jgi:hypothetical protein
MQGIDVVSRQAERIKAGALTPAEDALPREFDAKMRERSKDHLTIR